MSATDHFLIWASGHSDKVNAAFQRDGREGASSVAQMKKVGGAVLLASVIAPINWAIGSLPWSAGLPPASQWMVAGLAGLAGLLIVLVLDRSAVYALDTKGPLRSSTLFYIVLRIVMILVIGSFTAERVLPIILKPELSEQILISSAKSSLDRSARLSKSYDISTSTLAAQTAASERAAAADALNRETPEIIEAKRHAAACWSGYYASRRHPSVARFKPDQLAEMAQRCRRQSELSARMVRELRLSRQAALDLASANELRANTNLGDRQKQVNDRTAAEEEVEKTSLVAESGTVLWDLLSRSTGARAKFIIFMLLIILWETLPLTTKALFGQSAIGARLGFERAEALLKIRELYEADLLANRLGTQQREAFGAAMHTALFGEESRAQVEQQIRQSAAAMAPFEVALQILRKAEATRNDMNDITRRHPDLASMAARFWQDAFTKACEATL